ncbi:MAG: hypothetical protein ACI85Q_001148 [Salibacteraceae bacterium]|jgi:hypothetical protein
MTNTKLFLPFSLIILSFVSLFFLNSCATEGCTDSKANNFSYDADKDDGSCDYGGCTDPDALNFNSDARYDNGSCKYYGDLHLITTRSGVAVNNVALIVHVDGGYIGSLQSKCSIPFPSCQSNCNHLSFTQKESGIYVLRFWEIKQISATVSDTIYESQPMSVQVIGGECNTYIIQ